MGRRSDLRFVLRFVLLAVAPMAIGGCYAATAGAVLGILSISGSDGGNSGAEPLRVEEISVAPSSTPDRIPIGFQLAGGSGGPLEAQLEYQVVSWFGRPPAAPGSGWQALTFLPGSDPLDGIRPRATASVVWDARRDLQDLSASVEVRIVPLQDGAPGTARSMVMRAGNTPPEVQEVELPHEQAVIFVNFQVVDLESDTVTLTEVKLIVGGSEFALPADIFASLRKDYRSAPEGAQGSFNFSASELDREGNDEALREVGRAGFKGSLGVRISLVDFPGELPATGEGTSDLDINDPPFLALQPVESFQLESGIIPIRFTLTDRQQSTAAIDVEVDLADGRGFVPANEFPSARSSGTVGLATGADSPLAYTFYWDAVSQTRGDRPVTLRIRARDLEVGEWSQQRLELSFPTLSRVGELPAGGTPVALSAGDFDGDGFVDAAVACQVDGTVRVLRGRLEGLEPGDAVHCGGGPVSLAAGDFDGDQVADALVANGDSQDLVFLRGKAGTGLERTEEVIPLDGPPLAMARGDWNDDGIADAVVSVGATLSLGSLLEVRGVRGQEPEPVVQVLPAGKSPAALLAGDLNGDGTDDLAVANRVSDTVSLYFGSRGSTTDSGGLKVGGDPIAAGDGPVALALGDLDGDGLRDLIASCRNSATLEVLRGISTPLKLATASFTVSLEKTPRQEGQIGPLPWALAAGDFDGDGFDDAAVALEGAGQVALVRGGNPSGWKDFSLVSAGSQPFALTALDFDDDGFLDLILADVLTGRLIRLRGTPAGLEPAGDIQTGLGPRSLLQGDFDGNGDPEVLAANQDSADVTYLRGESSGLAIAKTFRVGSRPAAVTTGDYDGDGFLDAVVANSGSSNVAVLRGTPAGPESRGILETGSLPRLLVTGRFGGDPVQEHVAVARESSTEVTFLRGGPPGLATAGRITFSKEQFLDQAIHAMAQGDFRGTGFDDLVVSAGSGLLYLLSGGPKGLTYEGSFFAFETPSDPQVVFSLQGADFNDDGAMDLIVANKDLHHLIYLQGEGGPRIFLPPRVLSVGRAPLRLLVFDFDGDGFPDALISNNASGDVSFLRGGPTGLELQVKSISVGEGPDGLGAGDFDGDGFADFAAAGDAPEGGALAVSRGGILGLSSGQSIPLENGSDPAALAAGDFDGDGLADLLVVLRGSGSVAWFRQRYVVPHVNRLVTIEAGEGDLLLDPRSPPTYSLALKGGRRFSAQVCMVPEAFFPLPASAALSYQAITGPVALLREDAQFEDPATLTLAIRESDPGLLAEALAHPERLRVVRKESSNGRGLLLEVAQDQISITNLPRGRGVSFPIHRFGSYLVALERSR